MKRTTLEFTVVTGTFTDSEIKQIASNLNEVNPTHSRRILSKTLAELSYGYPKPVAAINVPISLWKVPTDTSGIRFQKAYTPNETPSEIKEELKIPQSCGYLLNSVFVYQNHEKFSVNEDRIEHVYEHSEFPGATMHILRAPTDSNVLTFPPQPDQTQKFRHEKIGKDVFYAYRSKEIGPHEASWQDNNYIYLALVQPASWATRAFFLNLLDAVVSP